MNNITIYTDGSCHTQHKIGAWAAILLIGDEEIVLSGQKTETTHNRMELLSVIKAFEYIENHKFTGHKIIIKSDSQYVVGIQERKEKLKAADFITKKGNPIQNIDLVEQLIRYTETMNVQFIKVKAHLKKTDIRNYNREVDKLSRQIVRNYVRKK
ncbi:MAG: ribonuclease HI [Bacteroidales bacterium]|nr:ribonuclease HI [Bacteroidales bacterium]